MNPFVMTMLKKKLKRNTRAAAMPDTVGIEKQIDEGFLNSKEQIQTSAHFVTPFWKRFYDHECLLNVELQTLHTPAAISHIYNPLEYAAELHCAYLRRFLDGPKRLLFIGMNPGANGMGQTGIPFGNISTVRDYMQITGLVQQPPSVHPKRPVRGMQCTTEEPSGVRIWTLLRNLAGGSLDTFSRQCFVHNFCPLIFFDRDGRNVTPSELKGDYKKEIRDICLRTLDKLIALVQPEIIVAVGDYIYTALKKSTQLNGIQTLKLHHPSPRALNNQNWPTKAEETLTENQLLKYIRNEI